MIRALLRWYISLNHVVHVAAVVSYMAVIYALSSMQINLDVQLPFLTSMFFNMCHVPLYFGLCVLIALYVRKIFKGGEGENSSLPYMLVALGIIAVYGLSDEYHQSFTGRHPSLLDLASDLIGGLLGILLLGYVLDRKPSTRLFVLFCVGLAAAAATVAYFGSVSGG